MNEGFMWMAPKLYAIRNDVSTRDHSSYPTVHLTPVSPTCGIGKVFVYNYAKCLRNRLTLFQGGGGACKAKWLKS